MYTHPKAGGFYLNLPASFTHRLQLQELRTMVLAAHHDQELLNPTSYAPEWHSQYKSLWSYVAKWHDATRLHFDFRLQCGRVFKSWVLPEGPCLDPNVKRLAILVDDHEINFSERVIPDGKYGAGPVMVWDMGLFGSNQDVGEALRDGQLRFQLYGEKLLGGWTLTRCSPRSDQRQTRWELRKIFDAEARSLQEIDIVAEQFRSVLTRRTLDEIARNLPSLAPGRPPRKQTRDPSQLLLFC